MLPYASKKLFIVDFGYALQTNLQRPAPCMNRLGKHEWRALLVLLLLAWLHGAQYALLLPPWGLIDEAQHFDYVVHLTTQHELPNATTGLLSPDIVQSLFATHHWQTFQWPTPRSSDEVYASIVGHSYEAYQPPLYYLLMAPVALSLPNDILIRLFGLRLATVTLSLVTVYLLYRTALLLAKDTRFALLVTFLLVSLPERTFAVSRLNNDGLVEVLGAAFCYVSTEVFMLGWTRRRTIGLGLLLAIGVLAKLSMIFWLAPLTGAVWLLRRRAGVKQSLWSYGIGSIGIILLFGRNLLLYGDITGYRAFRTLYELPKPVQTLAMASAALGDLFKHFWVIWWKGAVPEPNRFLNGSYVLLALLTIIGLVRLLRQMWTNGRTQQWTSQRYLCLFYLAAVFIYAASILASYYQGMVPTPQGRFWSPVILPCLLLFAIGLSSDHRGTYYLIGATALLWILDTLALWGNLLPYYYWSQVIAHQLPASTDWHVVSQSFWRAMLADKPAFVIALRWGLIPAYWLALLGVWRFVYQQVSISKYDQAASSTHETLAPTH